jgi:hypothetical protein
MVKEVQKNINDDMNTIDEIHIRKSQGITPPGTVFIVLSGKKQTGKDTSGNMIKNILLERGLVAELTAFAEPLKRMCIDIIGLDENLIYGNNEDKETLTHVIWDNFPEEIRLKYSNSTYMDSICNNELPKMRSGPMTIREVLQVIGTDIFRQMIDWDIWAKSPFNKKWDADVVIITDCRFPNEKDVTESRGGVIIRLERDTRLDDSHESETALDGFSFKHSYINNGSLDDLEIFLRAVINYEGI